MLFFWRMLCVSDQRVSCRVSSTRPQCANQVRRALKELGSLENADLCLEILGSTDSRCLDELVRCSTVELGQLICAFFLPSLTPCVHLSVTQQI